MIPDMPNVHSQILKVARASGFANNMQVILEVKGSFYLHYLYYITLYYLIDTLYHAISTASNQSPHEE